MDKNAQKQNILLQNTLTEIKKKLMDEQNISPQPGLLGKMGVSLFFFYYADYTHKEKYEDYAIELIRLMQKQINSNSPINFSIGLTGIGIAIEHLIRQGMLDNDAEGYSTSYLRCDLYKQHSERSGEGSFKYSHR